MSLELVMADFIQFRNSQDGEEDTDDEEKNDYEDDSDYDENKDDTDFEDLLSQSEDVEVCSLQDLCLKSIKKNFERFNQAYATTEDTSLRRHLLFLQRAYSQHMISEMDEYIDDSCLDFLLNEHLKEFDLEIFYNCSDQAILQRLSEIGHGFVKGNLNFTISYGNSDRSSLVKKIVMVLPNLHELHIPSVCDDEIVQIIASTCLRLQELYMDDTSITDEGVKNLFNETNGTIQPRCHLKVLSLKNTKVGAPGISYLLENMPSLQVLTHYHVPYVMYSTHKEDLGQNTAKKYNLTTLDLMNYEQFGNIDISDILTVCTAMCPHVNKLCTPVVSEKHLELISLFSELEDLSLDGFSTGEVNLNLNKFLESHGAKLKRVKLSYFSLSVPILLQNCPKLETLNLRDITFQWEDKDENSSMPCLNHMRILSLEHFVFEDRTIEMSVAAILDASPRLEVLDMAHCEIAESGIHGKLNSFCASSLLQELHFRCSDVKSVLLECILLTCSSLQTLVIHDCEYINSENIDNLYEIIHSKKNRVNIIWSNDRSELNSIDDFFDNIDYAEETDDDDYGDYEYYNPYDYDFEDGYDYESD